MKSIRETFLPDDGCVWVRGDLSQVELRMGQMYCRTKRMVELANRKPWEYDGHTETAAMIFRKMQKEVSKQDRYLAKKVNHARWRDMHGDKMSESVSKDTDGKLFITAQECQKLLNAYSNANPEIENIYFPMVRDTIQGVGVLVNSWGRRWDRRGLAIDDNLYRKGYSYYPQSECADWMNQYGLIPAYWYMMCRYGKPPNMQIHDEVAASVPIEDAYEVACFLWDSIEQTKEIPKGSGNYLCVPLEVKIGTSLYGGVEFNKKPERKKFEKKVGEWFEKERERRK